jgi:hypothetical protein
MTSKKKKFQPEQAEQPKGPKEPPKTLNVNLSDELAYAFQWAKEVASVEKTEIIAYLIKQEDVERAAKEILAARQEAARRGLKRGE